MRFIEILTKPTLNQSRAMLLGVFLIGFLTQVVAITSIRSEMRSSELQKLIVDTLGIYGIHLGVMIAGIFAQKARKNLRIDSMAFYIAFVLALLWNVLLAWFTVTFTFSDDSVSVLSAQIAAVSHASSFLVAGSLAYFFGKDGSK